MSAAWVLLTCVKDEAPYLAEHYAWYKSLGFTHFVYAHNDCTDGSEQIIAALARLDPGVIGWHNDVPPGVAPQVNAYRHWSRQFCTSWMGAHVLVCDADEFLSLHWHDDIQDFMQAQGMPEVVSFNWRMYGSGGAVYGASEPVVDRFTWAAVDGFALNRTLKSLFRVTPHLKAVTAHVPLFYGRVAQRHWVLPSQDAIRVPDLAFRMALSPDGRAPARLEVACLNHYALKSRAEYLARRQRGRGAVHAGAAERHTDDYFKVNDRNDVKVPLSQPNVPAFRRWLGAAQNALKMSSLQNDVFQSVLKAGDQKWR